MIIEQVKETVKIDSNRIAEAVAKVIVEKKESLIVTATIKALDELENQKKEFNSANKPDIISYSGVGANSTKTESFSETRIKLIKDLEERVRKTENIINSSYESGNFDKLLSTFK